MSDPGDSRGEMLRAFLAEHDEPCPACGYNLRGLTSGVCPECRQALVLRVAMAAPDLKSFAVATVGLSACGVLGVFLVGTVLVLTVVFGGGPSGEDFFFLVGIPFLAVVVDAVLVGLFIRRSGRLWFRSRGPGGRALIALGCWGLSVGAFILWMLTLFYQMI